MISFCCQISIYVLFAYNQIVLCDRQTSLVLLFTHVKFNRFACALIAASKVDLKISYGMCAKTLEGGRELIYNVAIGAENSCESGFCFMPLNFHADRHAHVRFLQSRWSSWKLRGVWFAVTVKWNLWYLSRRKLRHYVRINVNCDSLKACGCDKRFLVFPFFIWDHFYWVLMCLFIYLNYLQVGYMSI